MRFTRWMSLSVLVVLSAQTAAAQPDTAGCNGGRSPFQGEFVAAEVTAGMLLGFGMGWGLAHVGAEVLGPHGGEDPGLMGGVAGFAVGLVVGSSLGVHLAARGFGFPATYYEALGGALAGVLLLPMLPVDLDEPLAVIGIFLVPSLTSALASSVGAWSRIRPVAGATGEGLQMGLSITF